MKAARLKSVIAACVAASPMLAAHDVIVRAAPASDPPAGSDQGGPHGALRGKSRLDTDESLGITEARAHFVHDPSRSCFALTGLFEFNEGGIVLVYRPVEGRKGGFGEGPVPGLGRIVMLEDGDCRMRLQVSFDDRSAAAAQEGAAPPAATRRADRMRFRFLLTGDGWPSEGVVILPAIAEKRPPGPCLVGAGLFSVEPRGFTILFHRPRSELPFRIEERSSQDPRHVALTFSAPACRMTLHVEMTVRRGDGWVPVAPVQ